MDELTSDAVLDQLVYARTPRTQYRNSTHQTLYYGIGQIVNLRGQH